MNILNPGCITVELWTNGEDSIGLHIISLSLSLSLSHTHTHARAYTHTHTRARARVNASKKDEGETVTVTQLYSSVVVNLYIHSKFSCTLHLHTCIN